MQPWSSSINSTIGDSSYNAIEAPDTAMLMNNSSNNNCADYILKNTQFILFQKRGKNGKHTFPFLSQIELSPHGTIFTVSSPHGTIFSVSSPQQGLSTAQWPVPTHSLQQFIS